MRHGNIAVRIIEELLRVRAESMPVRIFISAKGGAAFSCNLLQP
jgi:hypothetical protein